ncbi:MAG: tRNA pseudouridine(55) synthase TruB [Dehalococcoidales bacterium]|nr:tRNA pseudouridine(55) synthase TruB [Dehalococcoidales bacterium]
MDGILNINKPSGKTSFSIVAMVKRLTGEKRVGHAGTLDPMAVGVLPVCLGQATRLVEYLMDTTKTYCAEIELGVTTDTYDSEGKVTQRGDASGITLDKLETALNSFRGVINQTPPMYSAVKHRGRPLYELARAGICVERKSRTAKIHSLELKEWQSPILTIVVTCGKGTYIRSLANDLGQALGCGASLKSLMRSRCGIFDINEAVSPERFQEACEGGYWESLLYPMDSILSHWSAVIVNEKKEQAIRNGALVGLEEDVSLRVGGDYCRAYTWNGSLLGILRFDSEHKQWQPEKVFN